MLILGSIYRKLSQWRKSKTNKKHKFLLYYYAYFIIHTALNGDVWTGCKLFHQFIVKKTTCPLTAFCAYLNYDDFQSGFENHPWPRIRLTSLRVKDSILILHFLLKVSCNQLYRCHYFSDWGRKWSRLSSRAKTTHLHLSPILGTSERKREYFCITLAFTFRGVNWV